MDWKDLEKMTVLKLREEALKYPEIEAVHGKSKPHLRFTENIVHTKSDLKHKIQELKIEREKLLQLHDHQKLHDVRRELHELKHTIRKIEAKAAKAAHG